MAAQAKPGKQRNATTALLLGCAVGVLALPSAVLAFSSRFDGGSTPVIAAVDTESFTPAEVDPRLSRSIAVRTLSKGKTFRFSPRLATAELPDNASTLRIAPTAYSLGSSRGYRSFAQSATSASIASHTDLPDLATFRPSAGAQGTPGRLSPRIALDERATPGRSPRTFGDDNDSVDLGGSYRLSRNLNVTAGVRYQQERDRLVPLTDGRQDSQAVYVGTQFRF
jgi:hypothetical protein